MSRWWFPAIFLIVSSCSSGGHYRSDEGNPHYYSLPRMGPMAGIQPRPDGPNRPMPAAGDVGEAVFGLLYAGTALALNPDYYDNPTVSGVLRCELEASSNLETVCTHVTVVLLNEERRPVARYPSVEGEFVFRVDEGKHYFVDVESRYYRVRRDPGAVEAGDRLTLNLVPAVYAPGTALFDFSVSRQVE